ncbi:MAG: cytochrome C oxidase subunit III [Deltaproteobacteria bacterium RIFCSPLOWO2_12_FULL_44_12]|nr:MAG: cytochrome C oxidase subunit III [Deltaproteobacteria bacterium RIFCSPHIGHO2_01_FULL_43_49]OGQ14921.1 MAG: cytochrome C oxidase subunit III [Deltaproteobacteria bacterium RIFCSPHIGHO2_02_FULL_44_53]OGQ29575.1 MAG: cytochrome C oxidase subunit III [Deltaproteobacteria bacterium RIFCSPHIGHO2_12_FULL_44_21]OGQ31033.1 MAG: cytochrome C oxidase subunit III [Deltaproteobacteria bacterium RIFCSPLOWO2_01_FULL_45_74]OGQ42635.1 MAG: cytochrome C oxidase subunit III [Deltaproteobacteria bacterium 
MTHGEVTAGTTHVVPHHFDSPEQAFEASKLGIWLFLVTEILLFGGLFVVYIIFRALYPEMFHEASHHLNKVLGGINTVVLICSSLTMALAVDRTRQNDSPKANQYMLMTLFFAACFMIIKYVEYSHKFHEGLLPGANFTFEAIQHPKTPLFFSLYFMMTGLHGIHVLAGMGLITWVLWRSNKGQFSSAYYTPVELVGIYWHLVDLIWIYLFPLLYLIG